MAIIRNLDYVGATFQNDTLTDNGVGYTYRFQGSGLPPALLIDPLAINLPSIRDIVGAQTPAGDTADRSEREIARLDVGRLYHFGGTRYVPYSSVRYPFADPDWCYLIQIWQSTPVLQSPPVAVGLRLINGVVYIELRAGNSDTGQDRVWKTPAPLNQPFDFVLKSKLSLTAGELQLFIRPWTGGLVSSPLFTNPIGYDSAENYGKLKTGIYRGPRDIQPGQAPTWWVDSARDKLGDWYSDVKPW